jgi:hypothetical protein
MERQFVSKQNTSMLHDILLRELKINENSVWIPQIKQIFTNNINFFLANSNFNNSLLELNKLFLKQTTIAINKLIPDLKKKITILPDDINFPHKIEDIKNIRKDLFNEELNFKKMEFDSAMNVEKPNIINFSDDYTTEKIINMEQLLSDKINERERDSQIEFSTTLPNTVENGIPNNLIKLNFERMIQNEADDINDINDKNINDKNINDKNINDKNIINENKKKKVNFNLDEIIPEIKTTIYQEQKSIELPKDNINYTPIDNSRNVTPTQFLPMGEFVKKINDLNLKIDNLTKIVEQLSNLIKNKEG